MTPQGSELIEKMLAEAHMIPYSIHPGGTKVYQDLKKSFWWDAMNRDIASFIQ